MELTHIATILGLIQRATLVLSAAFVVALITAPRAAAQGPVDIQSAGPLTDIWVGEDLTCQVAHTGDTSYEFYSPGSTTGSCGTFASVNGTVFGFRESPDWTPVSQTGVTGAGTSQSPYQVTTVVQATADNGPTGLELTESDSYVVGNEYYRTDMTLTNQGATPLTGLRLYHAADCYLQGSDAGYGFVDSSDGAVACTQNANDSPPALIEEFAPVTGGSHFVEGQYGQVYADVYGQADLPNTCDCDVREDNGMGVNWDVASLAPGQSATFSMFSSFSASGITSFPISATGGSTLSGTVSSAVSGPVASFTDPDSSDPASDFAATIDWGDGSSSGGSVSGGSGNFAVTGSHTYSAPGVYAITITINRLGNSPSSATATDTAMITGVPTPAAVGAPSVAGDHASFMSSANPNGLPTTVSFEYGLDPKYTGGGPVAYTDSTPAQALGADFASHTVSASVSRLTPNAIYHVRLVATNGAGTAFGPDLTFTTPAAPAPGPPALGRSFNISPVNGLVLVKVHGRLVPLTEVSQIPRNTVIDALHGTLSLAAAVGAPGQARDAVAKRKKRKPKLTTQKGTFSGAVFKIAQATGGAGKGLVTLSLVEGASFTGAPSYAGCRKNTAADATVAKASSKTLQLLRASAKGRFATKGRYGAATVLGTKWTTADRCDGTLIHDITDSVRVTDFVRHKTIVLHAGQSYLAKARK